MTTVNVKTITDSVKITCQNLGVALEPNTLNSLNSAKKTETSPLTKFALDIMVNNAILAEKTSTPVCQDTGMVIAFVTIGQNVQIEGGFISDAINEGVRQAYKESYFRFSVLDPITRVNTKDNTPAVIHYEVVKEDVLRIGIMLKGFGSENMSRLFMLTPADGVEGIKRAVVTAIRDGGGNPCPPVYVGVGIGGTMEKCALMSKHALLRDTVSSNPDSELNKLEQEINDELNLLNIGAQGFGGKLTSLKVCIEKYPTHLAGLPVAVTVQCHAVRHAEVIIC